MSGPQYWTLREGIIGVQSSVFLVGSIIDDSWFEWPLLAIGVAYMLLGRRYGRRAEDTTA